MRRSIAAAATLFFGVALMAAPAHGAAEGGSGAIVLHRGGADVTVPFTTTTAGVELFDVTASAPGADWAKTGDESAVVSVSVDGRYETDIVIPFAWPIARHFSLGDLGAGKHQLTLHFAGDRSPAMARSAVLKNFRFTTYGQSDPNYEALRFAPVLYGRNLANYGGQFDNSYSDAPLVGWHASFKAKTPGHTILEYSVVWSNEDGGTNTPALMARWGRTSDIEWIYEVEVDANGNRVPGSDIFQAPAHTTTKFSGKYEGDHAVLDTCTSNNNVCDTVNDPMRFNLSYLQSNTAGQPRENIMDTNPWTYQVTTAEMKREGKIEATPDPATAAVSDERNYLFVAVKKDTVPPGNSGSNWVGLSIGVKLKGSDTLYRSDHLGTGGDPSWSIQRDDPAASTVELPPGTTASDISQIVALRTPVGTDPGYAVHVTGIIRGFFLDEADLPQSSFLSWNGSVTLTAVTPSAVLWNAG